MAETPQTKDQQRKRMLTRRDNLEQAVREKKSSEIKKRLFKQAEFQTANRIMFYVAFRSEVRTKEMIQESINKGKEVIVPITDKQEEKLYLSRLKDYGRELVSSTYGIKEPAPDYYRPVSPTSLELVIVPGVAFDNQGNRLGYGGGYYDQFLDYIPQVPRLAISFEGQIVKEVVTASHDKQMKKIVTEQRVINCNNSL